MSKAYYNEIDPFAAKWLRNLISAGLIAPGDVDERSIEDVRPNDLLGYTQCHFFAGIGGWSYALRLAGWPDDKPVWTGSCPCQPFSAAGKRTGFADERHLWPSWFHLINQQKPTVIFGEQVDKALDWLDLVQTDLEASNYTIGSLIAPAAGVGAPHIRHRLWFVANFPSDGRIERGSESIGRCSISGCSMANSQHSQRGTEHQEQPQAYRWNGPRGCSEPSNWIECRDGKRRPVEPGTFPLAHGVPNRVGALRGYGNAIVPQVAAEVIRAYMEC